MKILMNFNFEIQNDDSLLCILEFQDLSHICFENFSHIKTGIDIFIIMSQNISPNANINGASFV